MIILLISLSYIFYTVIMYVCVCHHLFYVVEYIQLDGSLYSSFLKYYHTNIFLFDKNNFIFCIISYIIISQKVFPTFFLSFERYPS